MTRKDYIEFARMLKNMRADTQPPINYYLTVDYVADRITNILSNDNSHFDRERFMAATK